MDRQPTTRASSAAVAAAQKRTSGDTYGPSTPKRARNVAIHDQDDDDDDVQLIPGGGKGSTLPDYPATDGLDAVASSSKQTVKPKSGMQPGSTSLKELQCPVCLDPPSPFVTTRCGHTFCGKCLHDCMAQQTDFPGLDGQCPVCRTMLRNGWQTGYQPVDRDRDIGSWGSLRGVTLRYRALDA
ncbi:uncharacterized protein L969DRAFT_61840 [Mixia osmundae IAM 14324]|uniref:RING-type domain-containing protein n=1 Tax=Mixia osmundae (strain CBS 9802 / IAM 14324 / JCM 22182 / KY 12970) TaxID=764103 RepID=G7E3A0_MIXOS|nr:uncharacterized protein L969DRAFT_61840 [Mixia osmundae IAM 14324]KEI39297.1 hypothetical protein L969DRAFT_61840 [Mixia osmundae IAM 14324]GAA97310.1 hypothetical protein E5Q_03988 [Mixia osmundae IAM 14324]